MSPHRISRINWTLVQRMSLHTSADAQSEQKKYAYCFILSTGKQFFNAGCLWRFFFIIKGAHGVVGYCIAFTGCIRTTHK